MTMNRLQPWTSTSGLHSSSLPENSTNESVVATIATSTAGHSLFLPLNYEPKHGYPLLVWMHGPKDNEHQLKRIIPLVSLRNYVAVAPRATWGIERTDGSPSAYSWRQTEQDIHLAEQRVVDCIEIAQSRYNIASNRIFLAGYRCGGTMALRIGLKRPELFAGVASISGGFPQGNTPLARISAARGLPLAIMHGRDCQRYPIDQVCQDLRLLHSAGIPVTLRQYPSDGDLTTQMLTDLDGWAMEQITGVGSSAASASATDEGRDRN